LYSVNLFNFLTYFQKIGTSDYDCFVTFILITDHTRMEG